MTQNERNLFSPSICFRVAEHVRYTNMQSCFWRVIPTNVCFWQGSVCYICRLNNKSFIPSLITFFQPFKNNTLYRSSFWFRKPDVISVNSLTAGALVLTLVSKAETSLWDRTTPFMSEDDLLRFRPLQI